MVKFERTGAQERQLVIGGHHLVRTLYPSPPCLDSLKSFTFTIDTHLRSRLRCMYQTIHESPVVVGVFSWAKIGHTLVILEFLCNASNLFACLSGCLVGKPSLQLSIWAIKRHKSCRRGEAIPAPSIPHNKMACQEGCHEKSTSGKTLCKQASCEQDEGLDQAVDQVCRHPIKAAR